MANSKIIKILPSLLKKHFTQPIINNHMINIIGYGSGVFPQYNHHQQYKNTIDLIIITKNANQFHNYFHKSKPTDYQGLSYLFGISYIKFLQNYVFPLHFNHINIQNKKIKYSIVDYYVFLQDLTNWKYLTLAGRMHKPVLNNVMNIGQKNKEMLLIEQKVRNNFEKVLRLSLLRLIGKNNKNISYSSLYQCISQISYLGDVRYTFKVQNKNKVSNIVNNNYNSYHNIYFPILKKLQSTITPTTIQLNQNQFSIKFTPKLIHILLQNLPLSIYNHLDDHFSAIQKGSLTQKILVKGIKQLPQQIQYIIKRINRKSSIKMALYNFLGGSITTNFKYIFAKIRKRYFK